MPTLRLDAGTAFLTPLLDAIAALEWIAATTPYTQRAGISAQLKLLYGVRSAADAGNPGNAARATATPHRYTAAKDALAVVEKAGAAMAAACAGAAAGAVDAQHVNGLMLAWSSAIVTQRYAGGRPGAFAGLAV